MFDSYILTNRERREDVAFLAHAARDVEPPYTPLSRWTGEPLSAYGFFTTLCYHALAAQPAPAAVVEADWLRLEHAGVIEALWAGTFDVVRFALDPPTPRVDSKAAVLTFVRLAAMRDTWTRLLPTPNDPDVAVDVLHAVSGGMLKAQAFAVVGDMVRHGHWPAEMMRYGMTPTGRLRKRVSRPGLVDLPETADTFADLKAFSRATHAVMRLADVTPSAHVILGTTIRCELCDPARMAACPMPHCKRRRHAGAWS
jgi:hypothetical protein